MPIPDEDGELENITPFYDVFRNSRTGRVIRRNYLRGDGSLLLADIEDPKLGRRFILHSPAGSRWSSGAGRAISTMRGSQRP